MADDRHQKRPVPLLEVVERIQVGDPARVILSVSPCRSGTTALLRVFAVVGVAAHYQQIKNVMRWRMQGQETTWQVPQGPGETVLLKETIGPFTELESTFNPLEILLRAGFPPDRLQVLLLGRAPLSTWSSWEQWDSPWTRAAFLVRAYHTTEQIRQQALRLALPTTTLVYEALRDNAPAIVVERLLARFGLAFVPAAVSGWQSLPPWSDPASRMIFPQEPAAFDVPGVHNRALQADGLEFFDRSDRLHQLRAADIATIWDGGVPAIYDLWRTQCQADFDLSIHPDREKEVVR